MNKLILPSAIRAKIIIQTAAQKRISCICVDSVCELAGMVDRFTKSGDAVHIEFLRGILKGKMIPDLFAYKRGCDLIFPSSLTPIKIDRMRSAA